MKYKTLALAAAALMAGVLSFGTAQAANVMSGASTLPGVEKSQALNVQPASHKKWRKGRRGGNWRWRHRRHRFGGSGVFLGFGLAPFYGGYSPYYAQPYYDEPYYIQPSGGSRHVRWCLDRYRTYNVRTNKFRGYDGYLHRCRSPYRY